MNCRNLNKDDLDVNRPTLPIFSIECKIGSMTEPRKLILSCETVRMRFIFQGENISEV